MLHESVSDDRPDHAISYKSKLGVWLFFVYASVYAGFVAIGVLAPTVMGERLFLGLNLAVIYGFGLIAFALVLALAYNAKCSAKEAELNLEQGGGAPPGETPEKANPDSEAGRSETEGSEDRGATDNGKEPN